MEVQNINWGASALSEILAYLTDTTRVNQFWPNFNSKGDLIFKNIEKKTRYFSRLCEAAILLHLNTELVTTPE